MLRDRDVRAALKRTVLRHHKDQPDTLVLDELGLRHGACRVDIAVVNGAIHGYEIKSQADTLQRLASQIAIYSEVVDRATVVLFDSHYETAKQCIPKWWGVLVAEAGPRGGIRFKHVRRAQKNPAAEPLAIAQLLWSNEVADTLRERGYTEKQLRTRRAKLYELLVNELEFDELRHTVRGMIKSREGWRGLRPPWQDGDW